MHCEYCEQEVRAIYGGGPIATVFGDGATVCAACAADNGIELPRNMLRTGDGFDEDVRARYLVAKQRKQVDQMAAFIEKKRGPEAAAKYRAKHEVTQ